VGSLGGPSGFSDNTPVKLGSSSLLDGLEELLEPEVNVDDCELAVESVLSEKLLSLRARLLRSFLSFELLPLTSTGLARSNPNCSKERLKEVVFGCRESWSCGGQFEDILGGRTMERESGPEQLPGKLLRNLYVWSNVLTAVTRQSD